jgi:adenosylcobyric acid synthase
MNPILLKPSTDTGAQVILLGKIWGQITAWDYHTRRVEQLFPEVLDAYKRLAKDHDLILLEGAGSPAEINLREHDIVNMRMAHAADAACLLVGDIDRGGVFASLFGTLELLEPEDRARIRGFVINKFRGDEALLRPGVTGMERRLGLPCVGIVPYLPDLGLDEEDGVALEDRASAARRWKNLEPGPRGPFALGSSLYHTWRTSPISMPWLWSRRYPLPFSNTPRKWPPRTYCSCPAASKPSTI